MRDLVTTTLLESILLIIFLIVFPASSQSQSVPEKPEINGPVFQSKPVPINSDRQITSKFTPTPTVTAAEISVIPDPPSPTPDRRCIITVDGNKYDVSVFKSRHSGGDIFKCSTDMTSVFHDRHNERYLDMMTPYKL
jgi:hypothetical protein